MLVEGATEGVTRLNWLASISVHGQTQTDFVSHPLLHVFVLYRQLEYSLYCICNANNICNCHIMLSKEHQWRIETWCIVACYWLKRIFVESKSDSFIIFHSLRTNMNRFADMLCINVICHNKNSGFPFKKYLRCLKWQMAKLLIRWPVCPCFNFVATNRLVSLVSTKVLSQKCLLACILNSLDATFAD